jgi:hypothetical protein
MPKIFAGAITLAVLIGALGVSAAPRQKTVRSRLKTPTEIDGVPCAAGYAWRVAETGRLHSCTLARDAAVHGAPLLRGAWVAFNPDGTISYVFLRKTTTIQGHRCRGQGHGWMTHFYPNGQLRLCWLSQDEMIQNAPCARATFSGEFFGRHYATSEFHENGALASCRAAKDVEIGGIRFKAGNRISLDPSGTPVPSR